MILRALTDIGIRRKDNQDNFWCARLNIDDSEAGVICLCDGMGGLRDGAVASRLTVEAVRDYFKTSIDFHGLRDVLSQANKTIREMGKERGMLGTTCTVLFCMGGKYQILHIGDSRCYIRKTDERVVKRLTDDHTVIEKYKKEGKILSEELIKKYRNTLTRCIGVVDDMVMDYCSGDYAEGDLFLVCSDGFWHYLDDESFFNGDLNHLDEMVSSFIESGETDNISVSVLEV